MTTVSLAQSSRIQFVGLNGQPLANGTLSTFVVNTFTPANTWQDSAGTILNQNPIPLDAYGSASVWGFGSYRFILQDSLGNQVFDDVTTFPAPSSGVLLSANNLSDVASASTSRTNLGLGTAAVVNTGTTGATIGLLNGNNVVSGTNTYTNTVQFNAGVQIAVPASFTTPVGYIGSPIVPLNANHTLALIDRGASLFFTATATATIPTNATVAFLVGDIIDLKVDATFVLTLAAAGGVTLRWLVGNATGSRTVTGPGSITIQQVKTNEFWVCGGNNIS